MTIEYQIVWIDDRPDWVDPVIGNIKEYITGLGYTPAITRLISSEGFQESCSSVDLDLIIIDYNLPDGKNGDQLINELREGGIFKEIVFYSQDRPPSDLPCNTDGIFRSTREDAAETIERVIDLTVHKLRDLEVVRGLIIAATIDLEVKLEELMVTVFGESGDLFQKKVLDKPVYDFAKKLMFIQSYFKDVITRANENDKGRLQDIYDNLKTFMPEVVHQRNILAHARKTSKDGKVVLKSNGGGKKIEFDEKWLSKTRQQLREHMENLQKIKAILSE